MILQILIELVTRMDHWISNVSDQLIRTLERFKKILFKIIRSYAIKKYFFKLKKFIKSCSGWELSIAGFKV